MWGSCGKGVGAGTGGCQKDGYRFTSTAQTTTNECSVWKQLEQLKYQLQRGIGEGRSKIGEKEGGREGEGAGVGGWEK